MASTTASNGFLFVSSDANNTTDLDGTPIVTTATNIDAIDLSEHSDVFLKFQHSYRWWQDTRGVRISGDNGASWTEYQLTCGTDDPGNCIDCGENDNYPGQQSSENPALEIINISDNLLIIRKYYIF